MIKKDDIVDYHEITGGPITKKGLIVTCDPFQTPSGDMVVFIKGSTHYVLIESLTLSNVENEDAMDTLTKDNVREYFQEKTQEVRDKAKTNETARTQEYVQAFLTDENHPQRIAIENACSIGKFGFELTIIPIVEYYKILGLRQMGFYEYPIGLNTDGKICTYRIGWFKRPPEPEPLAPNDEKEVSSDHSYASSNIGGSGSNYNPDSKYLQDRNDKIEKDYSTSIKEPKKPWWHVFG
jgi:hypothetical protein